MGELVLYGGDGGTAILIATIFGDRYAVPVSPVPVSPFESPDDDPPSRAAMLTAYFDESFQGPTGYAVVAGWVGDKGAWKRFVEEWSKALPPGRKNLHMKELRWKRDRHKVMLERLGKVPLSCNLQPVFAAVNVGEYIDLIEDYQTKAITKGYYIALVGAVSALLTSLPRGERVEIILEEQREFTEAVTMAMAVFSKDPSLERKRKNRLLRWSFSQKTTLLEPADYLAYALMQQLSDPKSVRARLCRSILANGKRKIGGKMSKDDVRLLLEFKP